MQHRALRMWCQGKSESVHRVYVMQIAVSQLTCVPPRDCVIPTKTHYKSGLWLVKAEMVSPDQRMDAYTVLDLVPRQADLADALSAAVRLRRQCKHVKSLCISFCLTDCVLLGCP